MTAWPCLRPSGCPAMLLRTCPSGCVRRGRCCTLRCTLGEFAEGKPLQTTATTATAPVTGAGAIRPDGPWRPTNGSLPPAAHMDAMETLPAVKVAALGRGQPLRSEPPPVGVVYWAAGRRRRSMWMCPLPVPADAGRHGLTRAGSKSARIGGPAGVKVLAPLPGFTRTPELRRRA